MEVDETRAGALIDWVARQPDLPLLAASQVEDAVAELRDGGWETWLAGRSARGRAMHALAWEPDRPSLSVAAYGYPHPDEPAGSTALLMLARAINRGDLPPGLEDVAWHLMLCADPDQAARNDGWVRDPSLESYLRGNWRPLYLHLEVDYHFPIDHEPLLQPRSWAPQGLPKPLPESLAVADMIARARPDVLGLMHGNHASGAYSYFTHRPRRSLVAAFDESARKLGVAAHLGERPDPGKRWQTRRPDLLKERRLADRLKRMRRLFGDLEGQRVIGCVSVAQYAESLDPNTMTLTPEIGMFAIPGIDDLSPSGQQRQVTIANQQTRKGPRKATRGVMVMPDGSRHETLYHMTAATPGMPPTTETVAITRGMAGVEAVELRRFFLAHADRIWEGYREQLTVDSPRLRERKLIRVPAARVNDPSMLIFRADPAYQRPATVSQLADLRVRWGLQTCLWLGHGLQLYQEQGAIEAAAEQAKLLDWAQATLLPGGLTLVRPGRQARSQLARLLLSALAR